MNILHLVILILAIWRLSSLIARERGPVDFLLRIRLRLGTRFDDSSKEIPTNNLTEGITCLWCNSIWLGAVVSLSYYLFPGVIWIMLPFALSAGSLIVERVANG